jgi:hypothetical protein
MDNLESGLHISQSGTDEAAAECRHIVAEATNWLRYYLRLSSMASSSQKCVLPQLAGGHMALVFVVFAVDSHLLHSGLKSGSLHPQPGRSPVQAGNYSAGFT